MTELLYIQTLKNAANSVNKTWAKDFSMFFFELDSHVQFDLHPYMSFPMAIVVWFESEWELDVIYYTILCSLVIGHTSMQFDLMKNPTQNYELWTCTGCPARSKHLYVQGYMCCHRIILSKKCLSLSHTRIQVQYLHYKIIYLMKLQAWCAHGL